MRFVALLAIVVGLVIIAMLVLVVMDVVVQAVDSSRITNWIAKRPQAFLPVSLTWVALVISAASLALGWYRDGGGLLNNVLAGLVLIGPGLVLSNILVARYEAIRDAKSAKDRTKPLLNLTYGTLGKVQDMADDFIISVATRARTENADFTVAIAVPRGDTLITLQASMADAIRAVDEAFEARPQVDPDTLPLPDHVVQFPSCHNIAKLIELLDRVVPMPHAVLTAHQLLNNSQRAEVDFLDWHEDRSPLRPLEGDHGHWVIQPKLGFAEIQHFTQPSVRTGVDRRTYSAESYYHIVARTLSNAHLLLVCV